MNTEVQKINVDKIIPNRFQPRKNFDEESLQELANSISQHGIIQPLVLRKLGESFEIIAGERRYKAAMKVGLKEVPAIVMELDDTSSAEIALIENIQRKDLTAIEEAKSYEKILELGEMNQEDLAKRIGRNQSTVSNKLRLLNLSEEAQQALLDNKISERHARSLLRLKDNFQQNEMLNKIIENRLTVRETDKEIKNILGETQSEPLEIEEIIDLESDIPAGSEPEINPIPTLQPEFINETQGEIPMENNNQVYVNPELVPPEETLENKIQVQPTPINNIPEINIPQINIPDFDQMGINKSGTTSSISSFQTPIIEDNSQPQNNQGPLGGRFFNLDDQAANMNMENTYAPNPNNLIDQNQFMPNGIPNFDEHQINPQNSYNESINQPNIEQNIPTSPQPMIQRQDITGAVAVIRNTVMNLQNNGYIITTNEQDLGNSHQIIIEIKK